MIPLPIHNPAVEDIYVRTVGQGMRSIAVTAALPGEGTSTLAYALARRCAAGGRTSLLVDLNLGAPSVGDRLALPRRHWQPLDDSAVAALARFPRTGLSVLTAPLGEISSTFRESGGLRQQVARWLADHAVVIFDTAPVTAARETQIPAPIAAAATDGAILVVLAGHTPDTTVAAAARRLRDQGAEIAGAVLNDRHQPRLADELARETHRLDRVVPGMMAGLRRRLARSTLINVRI